MPSPKSDMTPLPPLTAEDSELLGALRTRGAKIPQLYGYLAHVPELLSHWAELAASVQTPRAATAAVRELAALRVAHLLSSDRQWSHHEHAAVAAGITPAALAALTGSPDDPAFTPEEQVVLRLIDEMVCDVEVRQVTFESVVEAYGAEATVELVMLIGYRRALAAMLAAFGLR